MLWGQVRPGSGARPYVIQRWTGHGWANVGTVKRTGAGGTFRTTVNVRAGTKVRLHSSKVLFSSPAMVVT